MNNALVSNWNKVVAPNDIVFHLGDFCFGNRKTWKSFCSKLNGTKYLIQGNHDRENEIYYEGFELVCDIAQVAIYDNELEDYSTLILCHYCLTTWPGQWNGAVHCFGHSHTSPYSQNQADYDYIQHRALPSYDVGVDNNNFTPISYDELKRKIPKERKGYLESLNVVNDNEKAIWLIDYWCSKDIRGLIQMPFSRHWIMHTEACLRIKNKMHS